MGKGKIAEDDVENTGLLTDEEKKSLKPIARINMVMTRDKDDSEELSNLLGTKESENRFMQHTQRLKVAYDICVGSERLNQKERDWAHFYFAARSIIFKITKGNAPDTAQMNVRVCQLLAEAIESEGVTEVLKLGDSEITTQNIFDDEYLKRIRGMDFSKKMQALVAKYNDRSENDVLRSEVYVQMADTLTQMIMDVRKEFKAGEELGVNFEEKAFYDILKSLCVKYDFTYDGGCAGCILRLGQA